MPSSTYCTLQALPTAVIIIPDKLEVKRLKWQYSQHSLKERQQISHYTWRVETIIIESRQVSEMWVHILPEKCGMSISFPLVTLDEG